MATYHFVIVGPQDNPLFEDEFGAGRRGTADKSNDRRHLNEFIVHAALDPTDFLTWNSKDMYLKVVDHFHEWSISAYATASRTRFMLLHDVRNEDGIRNFFTEVHELYTKVLLNPFYTPGAPIESDNFRTKIKACARKYL